MQMICHHEVTDFDAWKIAFDADDEARRNAGLTVLQVWKHVDSTTHAFFLLNVNNRDKAQGWIDRSNALHGDDGNTVTHASAYFIDSA